MTEEAEANLAWHLDPLQRPMMTDEIAPMCERTPVLPTTHLHLARSECQLEKRELHLERNEPHLATNDGSAL